MFQNQSQMIQNVSGVSLRSSISDIGSPDIGCSIDDDGIYITPLSGIEEQGYGGNSIEITLTGLVHQKKMNYILIMKNWSSIREVKQALPWLDTRTQCRVFWGGMELRDDDTLADCRIVPQSKVKIMITDTNTNKKDARQIEHKHMDIFNSIKQINNFELFSSLIDKTLKKTFGMQLRENVKHILHSYCKCLSHNKTYERKWSQLHTICYDYQGKLHDVERILRENNLYIDMWSPFGYDTPLRLAIAVNGNNTNLIDLVEFLLLNGARRMIRQTVDDLRNVHVMYPDMNRKIRQELVALLKPYASQDPCKPWKC